MNLSFILFALAGVMAISVGDLGALLDKGSPGIIESERSRTSIDRGPEAKKKVGLLGNSTTLDPDPSAASSVKIVDQRSIERDDEPACALTVRYGNAVDQPVTWSDQPCSVLTIDLLSYAELAEMGKLERLSEETFEDLTRNHMYAVVYIENEVTASIYPLNVAGRIYEVAVAD